MDGHEAGTGEEMAAYKQVSAWETEDVVVWMRGLDDCLSVHIPQFEAHCICGTDLLKLGRQQLEYLKVTQIGHQELLLEAIELLSALEVGRAQNSTMSFASGLSKKTSQLIATLGASKRMSAGDNEETAVLNRMEITAGIMMSAKTLLNWLDRNPSALVSDYTNFRQELLTNSLELTSILHNKYEPNAMKEACQNILKLTSVMMLPENFATAEPIKLVTVILQPREDTGLGISFQRTRQGSLLISRLTEGSPAADSAILKVGVEIVQINTQNVVAWEISKVVDILKASGHELSLIVKVGEPSSKKMANSGKEEVDYNTPSGQDEETKSEFKQQQEECGGGGGRPLEDGEGTIDSPRVVKLRKDQLFDVRRSSSSPTSEKEKQRLMESSEAAMGENSSVSSHEDTASVSTTDSSERYPHSFQERLQQRTSSEGQANRAKKKKKSAKSPTEYPPVAYRTEIVGGVVVRVPIQPKGKGSAHGKKDKKPSPGEPSDNDSSPDKSKAVFSDAKEVTFGGQTTKQVTVSGQPEASESSKTNGKKANPALMVPCFQLKNSSYEGWMCKQGGTGLTPKNWRKRWFVLKDKKLYYYKTSFDISALGIVDIVGYTIEAASDMKKKNGFKATRSGARTYCFQVESSEEMTKWMEVLREASVPDSQHSLETSTTIEASDDELEN